MDTTTGENMATIRKRRGKYSVSIRRLFHKPIYKTFSKHEDAKRWASDSERKLERGLYEDLTEASRTTLAEVLERYGKDKIPSRKSQLTPLYMIKKISRHAIGKLHLTGLTTLKLVKYRDEIAAVRSASTANKYLTLISVALKVAMKEWAIYLPKNPVDDVPRLQERKKLDRILVNGEYEALLKTAAYSKLHFLKYMIIVAYEVGARRGELIKLKAENVNWLKCTATLLDTKTNTDRVIGLSPKALEALQSVPKTISGQFFPVKTKEQFRFYWNQCKKRAGINGLRFHDIRHTFVTLKLEDSWSIAEVSAQTGHADLKSLQRYQHIRPKHIVKKLSQN